MTLRFQHYEVYPKPGRKIVRTRTLARARRIALGFGDLTEMCRYVSEFYSDGSSSHGAGGEWVVWNGRVIKDPYRNRRYRRQRVLEGRPNKRGPITPMRQGVKFSKRAKQY